MRNSQKSASLTASAKIAALAHLGRHHKLFTEKHEQEVNVTVKKYTDLERARALATFIAGTKAAAEAQAAADGTMLRREKSP